MAQLAEEVKPVKAGDAVRIVNETYEEHIGLVTTVHGSFPGQKVGEFESPQGWIPCINVVYVSGDKAKHDPYGQQIERMSSLQHYSQGPHGMPRPGRYWENL